MPVPNTFANATATIPLSQLDANFATTITLGNTAIQLGNTVSTLNNMTLANVTISSGNVTITNVTVTTANVTTANITTAIIGTANVTTANVTTGIIGTANVTTGNITTAVITTANVATANITTSQILNYGTANSVVYLNSSKAATANTGLQFDGTNLGLGVTPTSGWFSTYKVFQFGTYGALFTNNDHVNISNNVFINSSGNEIYANTDFATYYRQVNGSHLWFNAASGTAGAQITFTQAMTLDASGNLGIGTTSPTARLTVVTGAAGNNEGEIRLSENATYYAGLRRVNATDEFRIGSYGASQNITFYTVSSERMRLDASGNLGIGTSSPSYRLQVESGSTATGGQAWSHSAGTVYARIGVVNPGVANDTEFGAVTNNSLRLITNNTERARITEAGAFVVGKTSAVLSTAGSYLQEDGFIGATRSGNACIGVNRLTNDGTLIFFQQAGVEEGTISVSGNTVSYNPFLGSHAGAFADWSRPEVKIGTIFETINKLIDYKVVAIEVEDVPKRISYNGNGAVGTTATVEYEGQEYTGIIENERGQERDFNKHVKVKINDTPDSKAVYGVFVGWNTDSSNDGGVYNDMLIGAVGNYVIRMAAGQTPEIGDLVKADGTGCAIVQEDDIVRTKTVGKITNTIPQLTYEDGSFLVACVLYCG